MKYKEFVDWCNQRVCDGYWDMNTAMYCIETIKDINKIPFWKREKIWRKIYENTIEFEIVKPINEKIQKMKEEI